MDRRGSSPSPLWPSDYWTSLQTYPMTGHLPASLPGPDGGERPTRATEGTRFLVRVRRGDDRTDSRGWLGPSGVPRSDRPRAVTGNDCRSDLPTPTPGPQVSVPSLPLHKEGHPIQHRRWDGSTRHPPCFWFHLGVESQRARPPSQDPTLDPK